MTTRPYWRCFEGVANRGCRIKTPQNEAASTTRRLVVWTYQLPALQDENELACLAAETRRFCYRDRTGVLFITEID